MPRRLHGTSTQIILKRCHNIFAGQKRRAKKYGKILDFTAAELWYMVKDLPACAYCGKPVTARDFSIDHRSAVARGGSFKKENLCVAHDRCNRLKSSLSAEEFLALRGLLDDYRKRWGDYPVKNIEMRLLAGAGWMHGWGG